MRARFIAVRQVDSDFDAEIPITEFKQHREREPASAALGLELFAWFCFVEDRDVELEITRVELLAPK